MEPFLAFVLASFDIGSTCCTFDIIDKDQIAFEVTSCIKMVKIFHLVVVAKITVAQFIKVASSFEDSWVTVASTVEFELGTRMVPFIKECSSSLGLELQLVIMNLMAFGLQPFPFGLLP